MSTCKSRGLEELYMEALPYIISRLSSGNLCEMGRHAFEDARRLAEEYHKSHPGTERDVHRAAMMEPFVLKGIPAPLAGKIADALRD